MVIIQVAYVITLALLTSFPALLLYGLLASLFLSNKQALISGITLFLLAMFLFYLPLVFWGSDKYLNEALFEKLLHGVTALIAGITLRNIAYLIGHKGKIRPFSSKK